MCSTSPQRRRRSCPARQPSPSGPDDPAGRRATSSQALAPEGDDMVGTVSSGEQHQVPVGNQVGKRGARAAEVSCAMSPSQWPPS
eukprot:8192398-Pyramimonas_sp.AAC.1